MTEIGALKKQKYERVKEILDAGKQRYVNAGGNPKRYRAGFTGEDYLSDEERLEALELMREIFGVTVKDGYVHSQGHSWQLPQNSPVLLE